MEENYKVETVYLDDNNNIVASEKATRGVIRELDENGNLVRETWGTIEKVEPISDEDLDSYIDSLNSKYK